LKVGEKMALQESLFGEPSITDPRRDKTDDHAYWEELLWNSWNMDKPLFYLLHGIRCGGSEVIRTQRGFSLMPGEWDESEWDDIKRDKLSPFKDNLIRVFKMTRFGRVSDEKFPEGFLDRKEL
jgi:hypothetical protein